MYRNALQLGWLGWWPIAGCEQAARKHSIRDMDTPGRKRRHSVVNITNNLGTSVDLTENMHATPMSKINHENNVLMLLLVHY